MQSPTRTKTPTSDAVLEALLAKARDPLSNIDAAAYALYLAINQEEVQTPADACLAAVGRVLGTMAKVRLEAASNQSDPMFRLICRIGVTTLQRDHAQRRILADVAESAVIRLFASTPAIGIRRQRLRRLAEIMRSSPYPLRPRGEAAGSDLRAVRRPSLVWTKASHKQQVVR